MPQPICGVGTTVTADAARRAVTPLELLPGVVDAVATAPRSTSTGRPARADLADVVAFGARAVFLGRPYLYALMAGGEPGVDHLLSPYRTDSSNTAVLPAD